MNAFGIRYHAQSFSTVRIHYIHFAAMRNKQAAFIIHRHIIPATIATDRDFFENFIMIGRLAKRR